MAYVICEPCTMDKVCIDLCPEECIYTPEQTDLAPKDWHPILYIDPAQCTDCGVCMENCLSKAIFVATEVPAQWKEYVKINARAFDWTAGTPGHGARPSES